MAFLVVSPPGAQPLGRKPTRSSLSVPLGIRPAVNAGACKLVSMYTVLLRWRKAYGQLDRQWSAMRRQRSEVRSIRVRKIARGSLL